MMLRVRFAAILGLALFACAVAAEPVFRCEGKDGKVTYSDAPCPSDSRATRKLEEGPPVSTATTKGAPRNARDSGQIAQSRTGRADSTQENRQLDDQIDASRRECAELSRRVYYAKQDLEAASPNQRSTAELALRRAQDQFALHCPSK
jgi:hypothetical protein